MEASYSPGSPELTLIRKFGPPTDTSSSSSSNSNGNKSKSKSMIGGKSKSKANKSDKKGYEAGNSGSSGNNSNNTNSNNNGSSEFKSVLGCGGKKDYRRSVVDLTWRRGKVGDKITREYQRF